MSKDTTTEAEVADLIFLFDDKIRDKENNVEVDVTRVDAEGSVQIAVGANVGRYQITGPKLHFFLSPEVAQRLATALNAAALAEPEPSDEE